MCVFVFILEKKDEVPDDRGKLKSRQVNCNLSIDEVDVQGTAVPLAQISDIIWISLCLL